MTNGEPNYRKQALDAFKVADQGRLIAAGLKSLSEPRAREELLKYGLEEAVSGPTARFTKDTLSTLTDEEKESVARSNFDMRLQRHYKDAQQTIKGHADEVFKENGKYDSKLTVLVNSEEVVKHVDDKDQPLIEGYRQYASLRDLTKKLEEGKPVPEQQREQLTEMAAQGAYSLDFKKMRGKGYSDELCDLAGKAGSLAVKILKKPDQLIEGAKVMRDKAYEKAKKLVKNGEIDQEIARSMGETLKKLLSTGNPEKEHLATDSYFYAQNDYALGGRDFSEVFK